MNDPYYTSGFPRLNFGRGTGIGSPLDQFGFRGIGAPGGTGKFANSPQMQPNIGGTPMPVSEMYSNERSAGVRGGQPFAVANASPVAAPPIDSVAAPPAIPQPAAASPDQGSDKPWWKLGHWGRDREPISETRPGSESSSMDLSNAGAMGLLSAGAAMLQASGPQPEGSTNLAQILGKGLQAGMQGYGQAKQAEKEDALRNAQLDFQKNQQKALEQHRKNTLAFQQEQLKSVDAVRKEQIKGIGHQNKIQELQLKSLNQYSDSIEKSVKSKYITPRQAEFLKTLDPENGMKALVQFAGQAGTKVTGITSKKIPGTSHTALFRQTADGGQQYLTTVANKKTTGIQKGDIQLGGNLNQQFGVQAYDDGRYYQRDDKGNWKVVDENSFKDAMALRKESNRSMDPYRDLARQYGTIQENTANESAAGDLAIVFSFMKMLDPGSVVRESEFGQVVASSGYFDQASQWIQKNFKEIEAGGGQRLPPELRKQILDVSEQIKNRYSKEATAKVQMFKDIAERSKSIHIQDFDVSNPFDAIAPRQSPANTGSTAPFLYPEKDEWGDRFAQRLGYKSWEEYSTVSYTHLTLPTTPYV